MNKTFKSKKWYFPLLMASVGVFAGCTNSDYDFNEIDMTLGLGGDELLIPTSSTKVIALDDILTLEEGDCVRIDPVTGDYVFVQDGDSAEANPIVEKVTLRETALDEEDFCLKDYLPDDKKNVARRAGELNIELNAEPRPVMTFVYEADQPEIVSITSAKVTANMILSVKFTPELTQSISTIDALIWELPSYMVEIGAVSGHSKIEKEKDESGNRIILKDVPTNKNMEIIVPVEGLDFTNTQSHELEIVDGHLTLKGEMKLGINSQIKVTTEQLQSADKWIMKSDLMLDGITINEAVGKFDPDIDLTDLGDVEVSGTPDFLKEDGVNIDLINPQIIVTVDNEMNVPAILNATLTAIKDGKDRAPIVINGIKLNQQTVNKICICRDASKVTETYADYDKYEVPNLSELISTIPDRIKFTADTEANHEVDASFVLGQEYSIKTSYKIEAPLAFGENASIVYTDSIDDINEELEGFELSEGAYLEVTADVENKLPVFLSTEVTPLDVNGNSLSQTLKVEVEDHLPAAKSGEVAMGTLKVTLKGDIKQLDKLKFTFSGKASDGTDSVTGVTLNKNDHSLKLDNVQAKIVGKIIYDAN